MLVGGFERPHAALHLYLTRYSCLCNMHIFFTKAGHLLVRWDVPERSHKPRDSAGQLAVSRVWIFDSTDLRAVIHGLKAQGAWDEHASFKSTEYFR